MKTLLVLAVAAFCACSAERLPNIVGGYDVNQPGKYPWQASMEMFGQHMCGASLISNKWIVTAAHCIMGSASMWRIIMGMHDVNKYYGAPKSYGVQRIIVHGSYGSGAGNYPNDIALMELSESVTYNSYVAPIELDYQPGAFGESSTCFITGWGYVISGNQFYNPTVLQEAQTIIMSESDCKRYWGTKITSGMICLHTGYNGGCMGDSGGPLACVNNMGGYTLVGLTSWGMGSCTPTYPSVYTRISSYRNWIYTNSGV